MNDATEPTGLSPEQEAMCLEELRKRREATHLCSLKFALLHHLKLSPGEAIEVIMDQCLVQRGHAYRLLNGEYPFGDLAENMFYLYFRERKIDPFKVALPGDHDYLSLLAAEYPPTVTEFFKTKGLSVSAIAEKTVRPVWDISELFNGRPLKKVTGSIEQYKNIGDEELLKFDQFLLMQICGLAKVKPIEVPWAHLDQQGWAYQFAVNERELEAQGLLGTPEEMWEHVKRMTANLKV